MAGVITTPKETESGVKPGVLFRNEKPGVVFRQRFLHSEANLQFLDCGEYYLPARSRSFTYSFPERESLLFMWKSEATVELDGRSFQLRPYDTLYVPRGAQFVLANDQDAPATLIQTTAPAENAHPVFHSKFDEFSRREDRIRRLKGKNVYMMFDVSEGADKLVAGYTFFEPYARSWPPHNHTDQEETYIFLKGHGSMEVYESPETLSFVHNVSEGDLVTIPYLNYHPVFSQESPLEFIWCIAGERYWVGDKNKAFMTGSVDSLTT
ncbi:MAG: 5-deoxy-glucuronate isomerase [Acidobacteriaceae bacterium]|nr:5-deoxy-glucuronate isomerase [Acidobacteriaceae bacterium]